MESESNEKEEGAKVLTLFDRGIVIHACKLIRKIFAQESPPTLIMKGPSNTAKLVLSGSISTRERQQNSYAAFDIMKLRGGNRVRGAHYTTLVVLPGRLKRKLKQLLCKTKRSELILVAAEHVCMFTGKAVADPALKQVEIPAIWVGGKYFDAKGNNTLPPLPLPGLKRTVSLRKKAFKRNAERHWGEKERKLANKFLSIHYPNTRQRAIVARQLLGKRETRQTLLFDGRR